jgi:NAD(P)-dependent dehydrogenase (short-subunit alcohol dehydrogenase family)
VGVLDGRVALVAGASSGIGLATALAFANAGARVHAVARRRHAIEAAAGDRDIAAHALDISDRAAVDELAGNLDGPLDALVVAAGINFPERRLEQLTPDAWDRMIATNLTGAFNLVHAFFERLRAARGDVVLIGSVSGSWPDVSGPAYQAAKAGLQAFARGAGFEEHANGLRFTTINPGVVDTPILENRPVVPGPELRARMLAPEDVAAACLFVVGLPARAHVPELTILPTELQALGKPAPAR